MNCAWCCVKGTFFLTEIALEEHTCKRKAHRFCGAPCVVVLLLSLSRQGFDGQGIVCTIGFFASLLDGVGCGENHSHAAVAYNLRLAENADLNSWLGECLLKVAEHHFVGVAFNHDGSRRRWTIEANFRYRKSEQCACVKGKLTHVLRNHCHHTGVVRTR